MIEVFERSTLPNSAVYSDVYDPKEVINKPASQIREYTRRNWGSWGTVSDGYYLLLSDNIDELLNIVHLKSVPVSQATLKQKDKIFIHESSSFPSLLLGRLDVGLKRTTQESKADYIVVNPNLSNQPDFQDIYLYLPKPQTTDTIIVLQHGCYYSDPEEDVKKKLTSLQANFKLKKGLDLKYALKINKKNYNLYLQSQNSSNIISTQTLISYIYSQLTPLTDSEYENIVSMITAKDHESVVAGYNLLQYVNFADRIPELAIALTQNPNIELLATTAAKYIYDVMGTDHQTIKNYQYREFTTKLQFRIDMTKNPLVPSNVRDRVIKALRVDLLNEILDKYSEQLNTLEVTLNFTVNEPTVDENGEAETSDREMETE